MNPVGQPFQSRPNGGAGHDLGSAHHHQGAVQIAEGLVCGLAMLRAGSRLGANRAGGQVRTGTTFTQPYGPPACTVPTSEDPALMQI